VLIIHSPLGQVETANDAERKSGDFSLIGAGGWVRGKTTELGQACSLPRFVGQVVSSAKI
jgi:hypothetical protein